MTKNELIAQCKAENPKMFQTINDETFELIGEDYEKACSDWADFQLKIKDIEALAQKEQEAKEAAQAKLAALGLTAEDLTALGL